MATNITERVIKLIALDNQLISVIEDQGFLRHLHYIYSTFELQRASMCTSSVGLIQQRM